MSLNEFVQNTTPSLRKLWRVLRSKLATSKRVLGMIFMYIGESLLNINQKYLLVTRIIGNILQNQEIAVEVVSVEDESLLVRFRLKLYLQEDMKIDFKYFKRELQLQLGCKMTDIDIEYLNKKYSILITKTALHNLELGETPYIPFAVHEKNLDPLKGLNEENIQAAKKIHKVVN